MQADAPQPLTVRASARPATSAEHDERTCRVREVLDRVGDKWTLTVIHELGTGTRRFTEIKRAIPGLSQRMLTVTLRALERDGLVNRTVHAVVPPRVDYELTALGHTLLESTWPVMNWALRHVDDIDAARERYDVRWAGQG